MNKKEIARIELIGFLGGNIHHTNKNDKIFEQFNEKLDQLEQQIRNDVIDECVEKLAENYNYKDDMLDYYTTDSISTIKQLKE